MGRHHSEVEDKYDLGPGTDVPPLHDVAGVATVGEPREHQLEATYFDTADLRLAQGRITLRRRTGGPDEGWHLKLPAKGSRTEIHEPLDSGEEVPERLRSVVQVLVRDRGLVPVAVLWTRRVVRDLLSEDGRVLAEVADDEVSAQTPGAEGEEQGWREVEVELVDGDRELLDAVGTCLRRAGAKPARGPSKLARALGDRVPGTRAAAPTSGSDEAAVLVLARIGEQVDAMVHADPMVREDLPDSVHTMRVATRRLRSALATYRPFLDRVVTEPLRAELKWLGEVLGEARDAEVQEAALVGLLDRVGRSGDPEQLTREATLDRMRIRSDFAERYRAAHDRCLTELGSERYLAIVDSLDRLVARPSWTPRAQESIDPAVLKRVRHEWKRVAQRAGQRAADVHSDEALHEVRKAMKRLRYAVEPLRALYGKDAKSLVKQLKKVQDLLGAHHDSITLRAELLRLADQAAEQGEPSVVLGIAYAREVEEARRLAAEFEVRWPSVAKKSRRRWLG